MKKWKKLPYLLYKKYFLKKKLIKFFILKKKKNLYWSILNWSIPKLSSICFQKRFCIETKKYKSVFRQFLLSRHQIKYNLSKGKLKGYKTSSW